MTSSLFSNVPSQLIFCFGYRQMTSWWSLCRSVSQSVSQKFDRCKFVIMLCCCRRQFCRKKLWVVIATWVWSVFVIKQVIINRTKFRNEIVIEPLYVSCFFQNFNHFVQPPSSCAVIPNPTPLFTKLKTILDRRTI